MCAAAGPAGTRFTSVRRLAEIDSTNRYLLDEARAGAPEGVVVVADYQHAGRGRLGRRWEAPAGSNLLVSVLLRPALAVEELHLCTVAVALAAADACERAAGLVPQLKWPNDLVVGDRKLAGILAESIPPAPLVPPTQPMPPAPLVPPTQPAPPAPPAPPATDAAGAHPAVVVGLGLNVGWPPPEGAGPETTAVDGPGSAEHDEVLRTATSIWRETGLHPAPADVLDPLLVALEPRVAALATAEGRRAMAGEYRRRCTTLGRVVRVSGSDGDFTGTAADITVEGHLVVDVGTCLKTVAAGDVVHLRTSG